VDHVFTEQTVDQPCVRLVESIPANGTAFFIYDVVAPWPGRCTPVHREDTRLDGPVGVGRVGLHLGSRRENSRGGVRACRCAV